MIAKRWAIVPCRLILEVCFLLNFPREFVPAKNGGSFCEERQYGSFRVTVRLRF